MWTDATREKCQRRASGLTDEKGRCRSHRHYRATQRRGLGFLPGATVARDRKFAQTPLLEEQLKHGHRCHLPDPSNTC